MTDNNNDFNTNVPGKSKKKTNFFLKGINHRFFNKNKTIGKPKTLMEQSIFKKSNHLGKNNRNNNNNNKKSILFKDIILKCLQNLDLKSLGHAKQTCKEWKSLIETNEQLIWRQLCKRYWGIDHKRYSNNKTHRIYEVQWKDLFLLNYNMHHEKYYFTTHHQPFQLGEIQKKKRFSQTYLNINPYAFPNSILSQSSSYYPFPYPKITSSSSSSTSAVASSSASTPLKNNMDSNLDYGLLTPLDSSESYSMNTKNNNNNHDYPTASPSTKEYDPMPSTSSRTELPYSDSSSPEATKLLDQMLEENIETIEEADIIEEEEEEEEDYGDDYSFISTSSSSPSSPVSSSHNSSFSSYLSKVSFLNKFSNVIGHNPSNNLKKNYLMVWAYGQSEPYTVSLCGHYLFWIFNFREIQVYDLDTRKNVCRLKGHEGEIGLVLSNHQHYIVSFDLNSMIIVWDIRNFSIKRKINVKDSLGLIISMSVHRDRMVATNNKGLIMVWNITTGDLITSYKIPKEFIHPNEEENFTNVALWNDYIAFALQSSVYFIYDISKNKCVNIMYHPENQRAQEMFYLIRPSHRQRHHHRHHHHHHPTASTSTSIFGRRLRHLEEEEEDSEDNEDTSNINQILAMINHRSSFPLEEEDDDEVQGNASTTTTFTNYYSSRSFMEEEAIQETMMPNPSNSTANPLMEEEENVGEGEGDQDGEEPAEVVEAGEVEVGEANNNEGEGQDNNEEDLADMIARQSQYPFTLAINSHLLLTNGPERNKLSVWSLKTGQLLYHLSEANALEKLDLHLPTLRMNDLFCELNFAEFSTDYSFIYTTIQYEQETSLAVWDFRSDQYPQKPRHFDIIDLNIDEQPRKFWIAYEYENENEGETEEVEEN